jgi:transposase-like protein
MLERLIRGGEELGWWVARRRRSKGFRFPAEIISHCVWLYHRFPLSFREVEEMTLARGIVVSHETIRQWCHKFGQAYANGLRRRRARPGDKWHLDEVFIKINGKIHYLWRAVDQHGDVLDILVTSRRDTKAATALSSCWLMRVSGAALGRDGVVVACGQAAAGVSPVTWFQVVNLVVISCRYWIAVSR